MKIASQAETEPIGAVYRGCLCVSAASPNTSLTVEPLGCPGRRRRRTAEHVPRTVKETTT